MGNVTLILVMNAQGMTWQVRRGGEGMKVGEVASRLLELFIRHLSTPPHHHLLPSHHLPILLCIHLVGLFKLSSARTVSCQKIFFHEVIIKLIS